MGLSLCGPIVCSRNRREDTAVEVTIIWGLSLLWPTVSCRNRERTQLFQWQQYWACLLFYPLSPIGTFGDRKHLVWVTVILALSSLCSTGFPTKLCPPFPVPMPVFHAHHNLPCSSRKYLSSKHPWISIRPSSIASSKTAPFVATREGSSDLKQIYNVFISSFCIFLIIALSICFIHCLWRVLKIRKQSKTQALPLQKICTLSPYLPHR